MKTLENLFLIPILLLCFNLTSIAQNDTKSQAYWIHEDPVYPSMVLDYEETCKELVNACKEYNIQEAKWMAVSTDDLKYFFVTAIEKMGDLDKSRFANLQENMDKEQFDDIFDRFDNCYDTHYDYIVHLDNELSYMPDGVSITQEHLPYRKMEYWYITPQNLDNVTEILKEFKTLYSENKTKEHYSVFRSGFGSEGDYIMVMISANSAEDYERIRNESAKSIGPERDILYNKLLSFVTKVETLTGYFRMDLSYFPK